MIPLTIPATDGFALGATHVVPEGDVRAAVVLTAAMGVPHRYYVPFARFLAARGFAALAFDYRGIAGSRPADVKLSRFAAHVHEWGERDVTGAVAWLEARHPGVPVFAVGHSVGGQIIGLGPATRLAGVVSVASQSGYWRLWPWRGRIAMGLLWYAIIPAVTRTLGYLPMSVAGQGEDLPGGVALEWARWGRHPRYVLSHAEATGAAGYRDFKGSWRAYAFTDDTYAPERAVRELVSYYPNARAEVRVVSPAEVGVPAIGHFGFFRERFKETLWSEVATWLESQAAR